MMDDTLAKKAIAVLEGGRPHKYQYFTRMHGGPGHIHATNFKTMHDNWLRNLDEIEAYIKRVRAEAE